MQRFLLTFVLLGCAGTEPPPATPRPPAPSPAPRSAPCVEQIVPYRDWPALEASGRAEWSVELDGSNGGKLVLLGLQHRDNPADPQFPEVDRAWAALHPTAAYYEGPERPIAETSAATIAATGESGYVRFLARKDGVTTLRLDPSPQAEAGYILARYPRDQLFVFYILREVVRLRDRKGLKPQAARAVVEGMLAQAAALGLDGSSFTFDDFESAYRKHLGDPASWWDAPGWWFGPLPRADEKWTNRVNRDSSEFRNRHFFEALTASVRAGHRVFAAVGANHVPMIATALRCELARK